MATTDKPTALQTDFQKDVKNFESFLSPEDQGQEEQIENQEEIVEEEVEEQTEDENPQEEDESPEEELEEELEEQVEEEEQPQVFKVKIDGQEQEVTLEELQRGYSRQQDYTRKTQEIAQQKKLIEQQLADLSQRDATYQELLPRMEAQLKGDLENEPNWEQLSKDDPLGYVREKQVWDAKKEKLQAVQMEQQRVQNEQFAKHQQQLAKFVQEGQAKLLELIPEWSNEEIANKEKLAIKQYAVDELGFTTQEMDQVYDYRHLIGLRNAWLQSKTNEATKKKPTQKASVRAGKPGSSTRKVSVAPEKKLRQKLRKTGKTKDAAKLFERMLSKR